METQLIQALLASTQPGAEVRQQAEQFIKQAQKQPGYLTALLNISGMQEVPENSRLAAAIQLGLIVEQHWKFKD